MSRVAVANHAKLSWLLLRGAMRRLAGRANGHPFLRWPLLPFKADRLVDRAAGFAHRRRHARERNLFRPLRLRRQGRGLRRPLDFRNGAAVGRLGGGAAGLRLAAPSARRGIRHHPRQCARAGRRMDRAARLLASARLAAGRAVAPHHLLAQPFDAGAAGCRCALLPALPAQPGSPGALSAPYRGRRAPRRRAHAGGHRARLCRAVHRRPGAPHQIHDRTAESRKSSGKSFPTAAMSAAIPARSSKYCSNSCRCGRPLPSRNIAPPQALLNAIDRMMPMLRFFRHSEGTFAHFNGMGATPADLLLTLLAYDETRGAPVSNAPHSAYQRARSRRRRAHHGHRPRAADRNEPRRPCRLPVVRILLAQAEPDHRQLRHACRPGARTGGSWRARRRRIRRSRSTTRPRRASSNWRRSGACSAARRCWAGRSSVSVTREDAPDGIVLRAAHDGYADRFGIVHERMLMLAADGTRLDGEDHIPRRRRRRASCARRRINSPCAFICIRRSRRPGSPTATASC